MENISNQTLPRTSAKFEYSIKRRISKFLSLHSSNESTQSQSNLIHGQILEKSYQELFQTESSKRCPHVNEKVKCSKQNASSRNSQERIVSSNIEALLEIEKYDPRGLFDPINIHVI